MTRTELPIPKEADEQTMLLKWAEFAKNIHPELSLLFHIPNGGKRNRIEAAKFKGQGVKSGVPDLFLPCPKGGSHGLFIEMKRQKGSHVSENQQKWIHDLISQGYQVSICYGFENARDVLIEYLNQ